MKRHEKTLETYKRNHKGQHYEDSEPLKIRKEADQVNKLDSKAKALISKVSSAANPDEFSDEIDAVHHQTQKASGNRKSHKTRLKVLRENDDSHKQ